MYWQPRELVLSFILLNLTTVAFSRWLPFTSQSHYLGTVAFSRWLLFNSRYHQSCLPKMATFTSRYRFNSLLSLTIMPFSISILPLSPSPLVLALTTHWSSPLPLVLALTTVPRPHPHCSLVQLQEILHNSFSTYQLQQCGGLEETHPRKPEASTRYVKKQTCIRKSQTDANSQSTRHLSLPTKPESSPSTGMPALLPRAISARILRKAQLKMSCGMLGGGRKYGSRRDNRGPSHPAKKTYTELTLFNPPCDNINTLSPTRRGRRGAGPPR